MSLDPQLLKQIELLLLFDLRNTQEGLKVHHNAAAGMIEAAESLHDLGIITLKDGGYLTPRGQEAAELAEALVGILQSRSGEDKEK
jgi:uncharacterized protein (TIGR02647 family)